MDFDESIQERMWTVEEIQQYLNIGRTKAWDLIYNREIPAIRVGRSVRIKDSAVKEYVNTNEY